MKNSDNIKFFVVSLGCPKNQVDLEYMTESLHKLNWTVTADPQEADVSIINTCAFINDAKKESIEMIFEMLEYGPVIITGCLPQLYRETLKELIPEVSIFTGTESSSFTHDIDHAFRTGDSLMLVNRNEGIYREYGQRLTMSRYHTYIKISEGCSRSCSYCIIPAIRGPVRSRHIDDIKNEIIQLHKRGFREFELISEDAALYGTDRGQFRLLELIRQLDNLSLTDIRLRMMYIYPERHIEEITDAIAQSSNFIKYMDVPFQHTSRRMLKRMNRPECDIRAVSNYIRSRGIILRTSLMTGFPGESIEDYSDMKAFIKEGYADRVGIFPYSDEENTASYSMKGKLSRQAIAARYRILYSEAMKALEMKMSKYTGNAGKAVFSYRDGDYSVGRMIDDAPDIDPLCICKGEMPLYEITDVFIKKVKETNYICEVRHGD